MSGQKGRLEGRLIAVGITGSIAAYKAPELVRLLQGEGADVVALLSPSATRFVAPLTLEALTRHPAEVDVLSLLPDGRIGHIVVAHSADAIVVAPATAHWLAAMATGLAGDVVTAACLATAAPVVVAPAMDGEMYAHPATVTNVGRLRVDFRYRIVEPEEGPLASGESGVGRLANLPSIVDAVVASVRDRPVRAPGPEARPPYIPAPREADLTDRHVVVTAGGTSEPIDPIRSITNRSTGRMGVALAQAALDRGARVTLIAASVSVPLPDREGAQVVRVESTASMRAALLDTLTGEDGRPGFDALIMAAAVSDFRPSRPAETKIPGGTSMTLDLEPTPDLLAEVSGIARRLGPDRAQPAAGVKARPLIVGFAAETGSLYRAPAKITSKGLDLLVANDVSEAGSGFGTDTNRVTIFSAEGGAEDWPLLTKREVADRILDRLAPMLDARDAAPHTGAVTQETRQ
ncbi:MAG: bifunctional phosphopantothenoylcysteine decarboxylase/phosphopantothenate--cysteine ligase CoaBC [Chloroflexi bacterium]|nr:MAG: bifunctional phosphopantothenoylcysteine decarboxylase/phosphopantothenate--cysteine ligase CoaBC [Chloroflexota bacterium]